MNGPADQFSRSFGPPDQNFWRTKISMTVQHVAFPNCDHPPSSGSIANPDKNLVVAKWFFAVATVIVWYRTDARYENVLNY